MGEVFMGSQPKEIGSVDLMTPQQRQFLNSTLNLSQGPANNALSSLLGGFDPKQLTQFYQSNLVDPAMRNYTEQVLPSIQQQFTNANAGSSSALNQALARSATDLSTNLSGQLAGLLYQGQQQGSSNQINALSQILSLLGQKQFQPLVQGPTQGILGPLLQSLGQIGSASIF